MGKYKKNVLQNMALLILFAVLFCVTLLTSVNTLSASTPLPLQSNLTTITPPPQQQQSQVPTLNTTYPPLSQSNLTTITPPPQQQQSLVPQQNQQVVSPPQFPQISWDELEEAGGFIANGQMDSTLYTINGNWNSLGNWSMTVADGVLSSFDTTMAWHNGTSGHTHEFRNFEPTDDVDISAEDETISVAGTMDIGTNGVVSWQEIPSEIVIEGGRIITVSLDDEGTNRHFGGQSVHGNLTSLTICSTGAPGAAMEVSPAC
jgi:hypothetical protein